MQPQQAQQVDCLELSEDSDNKGLFTTSGDSITGSMYLVKVEQEILSCKSDWITVEGGIDVLSSDSCSWSNL